MLKVVHRTSKLFIVFCLAFFATAGVRNIAHADTTTYQVNLYKTLKITIPTDLLEIAVNPSTKPFDSKSVGISVSTNNNTGYYMTMSSDTTNLYKTDDGSKTLETLSEKTGGYTESNFETNKWGYKIGSANYTSFTSGTQIAESDTMVDNDVTTLTFAAKVDFLQASGTYKTKLEFLAVANPTSMLIQDLDSVYCTETPTWVLDARDGEEYMIKRTADGNCWMMDNLRLDPAQVPLVVLKGNTNASDGTLTYLKNGGGTGRYTSDAVIDEQAGAFGGAIYDKPYVYAAKKDEVADTVYGVGSGKVGAYYNFCAASAGSYCYKGGEGVGNATEDVCPSGWRLPAPTYNYDTDEDWLNTYRNVYSNDFDNFANDYNLVFVGHIAFYNSEISEWDREGSWWGGTIAHDSAMEQLKASRWGTSGSINNGGSTRYNGFPIRCIMKKDITTVTYLQDVTKQMVADTAVGTVVTLKDKRDNEEYRVAKLADGNIWMLENLRLELTEVSLETLQGNTNAADETLTYLKNGGGTEDDDYPITGVTTDNDNSYGTPIIINEFKDTIAESKLDTSSSKVGVFYNACATSAGSSCHRFGNTNDLTQDICPSSWRLPTGNDTGEYRALYNALNAVTASDYVTTQGSLVFMKALNMGIQGYNGYDPDSSWSSYWTSTHSGTSDFHTAEANTLSPWSYFWEDKMRGNRLYVRCIAKPQ